MPKNLSIQSVRLTYENPIRKATKTNNEDLISSSSNLIPCLIGGKFSMNIGGKQVGLANWRRSQ